MDLTKLRNIAVIAHVDHGKTTLVDALLKQSNVFRANQAEMQESCILDSNELEREKGITILAKNTAIQYGDYKINIIDTPGHADFSGEVERTLGMADGALLIVDAQEGPMPQTRFVLKKAIQLDLKIIVVINKIDKTFARVAEVEKKTNDLFLELASKDHHLEFPILYAVGRAGKVFYELPSDFEKPGDIIPLLETIVKEVPAPKCAPEKPFKMLVSSLDYDNHTGRIIIGKISQGKVAVGQKVVLSHKPTQPFSITKVFLSKGLDRCETTEAEAGEIVALTGIGTVNIGETVADPVEPTAIPSAEISEPTLHMYLGPNTSPFAGLDGKYVTSRQLEERLERELETNLSLRLKKLESGRFVISGKGELHLAILLETLRREGFEMEIGKPEVIFKEVDGSLTEPVEEVSIIVPNEFTGTINRELGRRQAKLIRMEPISDHESEFIYQMPTRNILGLRSLLLTGTKGTVVFNSQILGFEPKGADLPKMRRGVLIASEPGETLAYGLETAQGRGETFVGPGVKVYEGMIVGQNSREEDLEVNVVKGKKLTNMREKATNTQVALHPPVILSLEQSMDFLEDDELLEITPLHLRLRKKYLKETERRRVSRGQSPNVY